MVANLNFFKVKNQRVSGNPKKLEESDWLMETGIFHKSFVVFQNATTSILCILRENDQCRTLLYLYISFHFIFDLSLYFDRRPLNYSTSRSTQII